MRHLPPTDGGRAPAAPTLAGISPRPDVDEEPMRRHTAILAVGALVAVIVLVAVAAWMAGREGDESAEPAPQPPAVLFVAGIPSHPGDLDPHTASGVSALLVLEQLYDTLVYLGPDLRPQPGLATHWEVDGDGLVWTFHLRRDVTFHDGTPLHADDVVASLQRARSTGVESPRLDLVTDLRAPDDLTVEVELDHPAADLPARLGASPRLAIVPADSIEQLDETGTPPPGTGPFRQVSPVDGAGGIDLEAVDHHTGTPRIDRLHVRVVDADTGLEALRDGRLHWLAAVEPEQVEQIEQDHALEVTRIPGLDYFHLGLNLQRPPFDERATRHAVGLALDREAIVAAARPGAATPNQTAIPAGSFWHHGHAPFRHDLDEAQALIERADIDEPVELLATDEVADSIAIAAEVAEQLAAVGLEVDVRELDFEEFLEAQAAGDFDLYALGWAGDLDPDGVYRPVHHSRGSRNYQGLVDDDIDDLLAAARQEHDLEERAELYARATEAIVDRAAYLYLYNADVLRAWSSDLRGVRVRPDGLTRFSSVRIAEPADPPDEPAEDDVGADTTS
jgi:peptide/nickel transport system substrate-binding protein